MSHFELFYIRYENSSQFDERLSFLHLIAFETLSKTNWLYMGVVYFWTVCSVPLTLCLFLCQYQTVLITAVALQGLLHTGTTDTWARSLCCEGWSSHGR